MARLSMHRSASRSYGAGFLMAVSSSGSIGQDRRSQARQRLAKDKKKPRQRQG